MGDFNRTPNNMMRSLQQIPTDISRRIVYRHDSNGAALQTQQSGLALDFAIVGGGPFADRDALAEIHATEFEEMRIHSDHRAIRFRVNVF